MKVHPESHYKLAVALFIQGATLKKASKLACMDKRTLLAAIGRYQQQQLPLHQAILTPCSHKGQKHKGSIFTDEMLSFLECLVKDVEEGYLVEFAQAIRIRFGFSPLLSTIHRALHKLGYTRKVRFNR